jgi:phosphoketolase
LPAGIAEAPSAARIYKEKSAVNKAMKAAKPDDALSAEDLRKVDAYWRAANYLSVGQIYDIDRFHLVMDVVDRAPELGAKAVYLKQLMRDKRLEHKRYIVQHGEDLPQIRDWTWPY